MLQYTEGPQYTQVKPSRWSSQHSSQYTLPHSEQDVDRIANVAFLHPAHISITPILEGECSESVTMPVTVISVCYDVTGIDMKSDRMCELTLERTTWSFWDMFCLSHNRAEFVCVSVDKLRFAMHS